MNFYRNRLALGAIPQMAVGGILSPSSLPNLELWFDATTIGVEDGASISQWDDLSGNDRHATEATNKPTYDIDGLNSLEAVKFGGSADVKLAVSSSFALTEYSLFVSYRTYQYSAYYPILIQQDNVNTGIVVTWGYPTRTITYRNYANGNNYDVTGAVQADSTNYVIGMTHGSSIYGYANGVADGDGGGQATEVTKTFTMGNSESTGNQFDGWIGEIALYSRVLSASELIAVHAYFINKWT